MADIAPRIYVASLSDYNAGILHGVWIDVSGKDAEEIQNEVDAMLAESPAAKRYGDAAEEWAIHDYEGFGGLNIGEWSGFEAITNLAEQLEEYGAPYVAYVQNTGAEYADAAGFEESYIGTYASVEDYAEEYLNDIGALADLTENLRSYFNFEAYGRDLILGGDIWEADNPEGGVFIFRNI